MKFLFIITALVAAGTLIGCEQNGREPEGMERAVTDSTSVYGMEGRGVKLLKKAAINFKVKDVEQSSREVAALAEQMDGMIFNLNLQSQLGDRKELPLSEDSILSISTFHPSSEITVRVPANNLQAFMFEVAELGYFTGSSSLSIEDKSLVYLQNALLAKNRKEVLSKPIKVQPSKSSSLETIRVKDEIVDKEIQNRQITADADYSTVSLSLFQNPVVRKETIVNYAIADYQLSYFKRLAEALQKGLDAFLGFVLILAQLWVFIFAGVCIFFLYRAWFSGKRPIVS